MNIEKTLRIPGNFPSVHTPPVTIDAFASTKVVERKHVQTLYDKYKVENGYQPQSPAPSIAWKSM